MSQSDKIRESVSAFMDGELPEVEGVGIVISCGKDAEVGADWSLYHCIGDVMRSTELAGHAPEFCARLASRLEHEPHIFAPASARARPLAPARRHAPAYAAAGVALIAVVTGIVLSAPESRQSGQAAMAPATSIPVERAESIAAPVIRVSREYLAAHDQYSSGLAMQGLVSQVRNAGPGNGK